MNRVATFREKRRGAELPVIPGSVCVCVCILCFICECQMSRQFPFLMGAGQKGEIQSSRGQEIDHDMHREMTQKR